MPHLHLETTADLPENADIPDILEALCTRTAETPGVDPSRVRAYHTLRSVWHVGTGAPPAFVHLTLFLLEGRDAAWKRSIADSLMLVMKDGFAMSVEAGEVSITLDVREMDPHTYTRL